MSVVVPVSGSSGSATSPPTFMAACSALVLPGLPSVWASLSPASMIRAAGCWAQAKFAGQQVAAIHRTINGGPGDQVNTQARGIAFTDHHQLAAFDAVKGSGLLPTS